MNEPFMTVFTLALNNRTIGLWG